MSKKILVAYFSASGVTAKAAWKLSEAAGEICMRLNQRYRTAVPIWTGQIKKVAAAWR